jgi:hypothetical protein
VADPIRETIVAEYVTQLKTIRTANGYEIDVGDRVTRHIVETPNILPVIAVITEGEQADAGRPVRHYKAVMTVHCWITLRRTQDLDTWVNRAVADVKKAITGAATLRGGHTTGTLASVNWTRFFADIPNVMDMESALEYAVQQVTFKTEYVTKHDDPYVGRGTG